MGPSNGPDYIRPRTAASVMTGPPPICEGDLSIREASRVMADHRAILVRTPAGYGLVTDSDLRRRVLAAGLSSDRPIVEVMTFPVRTVDPESQAEDVVLEMLEAGIHHLPVVRGKSVIGMVSDLELLETQRRTPFALRDRIDSARTPDDLVEVGQSLPSAAVDLWNAGVDTEHIGQWLSALTDRLTARLLDAGVERLGPAPVSWAWLALGSLGRREQALTADQDHALIYANGGEAHDAYFSALADEVVNALAAAGFPKCDSRVMATEHAWRMSLGEWLGRLDQWMAEPDLLYSFSSGIVFDYRQIGGTFNVVPELDRMTGKAARNSKFIRRLGSLALAHNSPLGLFGGVRTIKVDSGQGVLDIKKAGLFPVTEMARALALSLGFALPSTLERLRRVAENPEWMEAASLTQVFKAMQQVRFRHQANQRHAGLTADDLIVPRQLDRLTQLHLRDSFRVLSSVLDELSYRLDLVR
jgi:CBS domain-containing protein